ncbi:putative bifunctional diguanylate cyclase/phosphodiesterase [Oryzibacter oryziterrae]|uniref:putative bifunctional diguanylate cyclase/phosphodiesterase n=1 Tax=Oryzibacter oryziterrae TaxID=2766474 RepID=UPI001F2D1C8F|nr:EAL domain-containing protein [Oryzibacter oryziterrae]
MSAATRHQDTALQTGRPEVRRGTDAIVASTYRPLLKGLLVPGLIYYCCITIAHLIIETGASRAILSGLALTTAFAFGFAYFRLLRETISLPRLEAVGAAVFSLVYLNVALYQVLHFEPQKLIYFVIIVVLFSLSAATRRLAVAGVVVPMVTLYYYAYTGGPAVMGEYGFVGFAGAVSAGGMSWLVRGVVLRAVKARLTAEELRISAQRAAHYDLLTALPNRRQFFSELSALTRQAERHGESFYVGVADLDGFKPVNDLYGHVAGDALLSEVGRRLGHFASPSHFIARLGGDEFAFILKGVSGEDEVVEFCNQIGNALREKFDVNGAKVGISCTFGAARFPDAGREGQLLYERADYALYSAKQTSRGDLVLFNERLENEMNRNGEIDHTLRNSDLAEELFVVFQPQVDAIEQKTVGFEALARWHSKTLGMVPPDVFIRGAERAGLIEQITAILLQKALAAMAEWPEHIRLSFNLSVRDLMSPASISTICWLVRESGIDPRRIEFEITETSVMTNFDLACESLKILTADGSRIALDDFGSGYSSFGYIHRLPLNKIKLDRCFVTQLQEGGSSRNVAKAIIELCRTLELDCIIEGVETEDDLENMLIAGGRYFQGYLFSKPLGARAAQTYLAKELGLDLPGEERAAS